MPAGSDRHGVALDQFAVDRDAQGLTHALVLERVLSLDVGVLQFRAEHVERQEDRAHLVSVHDLELGVAADAGHVLCRQVRQHVELARQQRGHARRVGLDRRVDDLGHVAAVFVPPVLVDRHRDLLVGLPAGDLVGAGAVDVSRSEVFFLVLVVLHVHRLVLFGPGLAHHPEVDQIAQQHRIGRGQDDIDGVVVDLLDVADAGHVDRHRALGLLDATEIEDHVVGRERRSVLELDALAQFETHLGWRDIGPLGRQRRFDFELRVVTCQPLVGVHQDGIGRRMVLRMWIQGQDVVLRAPFQGNGVHRRQSQRSCHRHGCKNMIETHGEIPRCEVHDATKLPVARQQGKPATYADLRPRHGLPVLHSPLS